MECGPCKKLGFSIVAHYAPDRGKTAMCYDHMKFNKPPKVVQQKLDAAAGVVENQPQENTGMPRTFQNKTCICGCGEEFTPTGSKQSYAPGHSPTQRKLGQPKTDAAPKPRAKSPKYAERQQKEATYPTLKKTLLALKEELELKLVAVNTLLNL